MKKIWLKLTRTRERAFWLGFFVCYLAGAVCFGAAVSSVMPQKSVYWVARQAVTWPSGLVIVAIVIHELRQPETRSASL